MPENVVSRREFVKTGAMAAAGMSAAITPTYTVYAGNPSQGGYALHDETFVGPIAAGGSESRDVTIPGFPDNLTVTIWAVVDPDNLIEECNDGNNADAADAAIQSCVDIQLELERIRAEAPSRSALRLLFSGFGLALGPVIEGTLGSSVKVDYTIIGEPVNTAARVEALTRTLDAPVLMTDDVCAAANGAWTFADAGVFDLGGASPTTVRSLVTPATAPHDMRATVAHHLAQHPAADG